MNTPGRNSVVIRRENQKIPRVTNTDNVLKMMMTLKTGQSVTLLNLGALGIWA